MGLDLGALQQAADAPVGAVARGVARGRFVPVRDSKRPAGPVLDLPATAFTTFVAGVKDGRPGAV
ncbi:DUF397 domain-containing protein [Streptomyces sp. SJL17-4]|uniref:DUF397 domain-containing protein n=1 Tax=Streptomyces sp. SJL17-4 TaxID=2967224 RepID=UPI0030CD122B